MKTYLFSSVPVMVEDEVRQTLLHYDICHKSPEFEKMFVGLQEKILRLFQADDSYYAVVFSGSGTSANETCLSSVFKEGEKALLINNGEFGGRLLESLTPDMGKTVYLNLAKHYQKAVTAHQTPNTPNVNLFWPLDAALDFILNKEGLDNYIARHAECSRIIREGLKDMGLKFLLPEEKMANTVTSVFLPEGKDCYRFLETFRKHL